MNYDYRIAIKAMNIIFPVSKIRSNEYDVILKTN